MYLIFFPLIYSWAFNVPFFSLNYGIIKPMFFHIIFHGVVLITKGTGKVLAQLIILFALAHMWHRIALNDYIDPEC